MRHMSIENVFVVLKKKVIIDIGRVKLEKLYSFR